MSIFVGCSSARCDSYLHHWTRWASRPSTSSRDHFKGEQGNSICPLYSGNKSGHISLLKISKFLEPLLTGLFLVYYLTNGPRVNLCFQFYKNFFIVFNLKKDILYFCAPNQNSSNRPGRIKYHFFRKFGRWWDMARFGFFSNSLYLLSMTLGSWLYPFYPLLMLYACTSSSPL